MKKLTKKNKTLNDVVAYFGGIPKLAAALGIARHAIYQWDHIPVGRAFQIEVLTNGYFRACDLTKSVQIKH